MGAHRKMITKVRERGVQGVAMDEFKKSGLRG
jgi:hypothetical protein